MQVGYLQKTIVLVGLMGAGKTSIGKRLARRLKIAFADSDQLIEEQIGHSVSWVFENVGEAAFRSMEYKTIAGQMDHTPHVLATGGGAFIQPNVRQLLKEKAITVWLKADLEVLLERVLMNHSRPLLTQGDVRATMERLMNDRYPIYAESDIVVESGYGSHKRVVESIVYALRDKNYV